MGARVSEEEIRAAVSFISRHNNSNVAITYHTFSGVILRPFSTKPDKQMETGDLSVFELMGERGKKLTGCQMKATTGFGLS